MQRIATCEGEWICTSDSTSDNTQRENITGKALAMVMGIVKDTLVMSVVVMLGVVLTLLMG